MVGGKSFHLTNDILQLETKIDFLSLETFIQIVIRIDKFHSCLISIVSLIAFRILLPAIFLTPSSEFCDVSLSIIRCRTVNRIW